MNKFSKWILTGIFAVLVAMVPTSIAMGALSQYGLPGIYNSSAFTLQNGTGSAVSVDQNGKILVSPQSSLPASVIDLDPVAQDIVPDAANTRNLGATNTPWGNIFGQNVYVRGNITSTQMLVNTSTAGSPAAQLNLQAAAGNNLVNFASSTGTSLFNINTAGQVLAGNGAVGTPSYSFIPSAGSATSGMYLRSATQIALSVQGSDVFRAGEGGSLVGNNLTGLTNSGQTITLSGTPMAFANNAADSGTNAAYTFNNTVTLTAGRNLMVLNNNGTPKIIMSAEGNIDITGFAAIDTIIPHTPGSSLYLKGRVTDGATVIANRFGNLNALSTAGAKIASFYSDDFTTEKVFINKDGGAGFGTSTVGGKPFFNIQAVASSTSIFNVASSTGSSVLTINANGNIITAGGNVGINSSSPNALLTVGGTMMVGSGSFATKGTITSTVYHDIIASGFFENGTGYMSDFVFEPDYKLMNIKDYGKFITQEKHLPNVPKSGTVKGVYLSEKTEKLLEAIEVQALYIVDLEKRVSALETGKPIASRDYGFYALIGVAVLAVLKIIGWIVKI